MRMSESVLGVKWLTYCSRLLSSSRNFEVVIDSEKEKKSMRVTGPFVAIQPPYLP